MFEMNPNTFTGNSGPGIRYTDRSGIIVLGGTAQILAPDNLGRRGFFIQSHSTFDMWITSLGGDAKPSQPCLRVPPRAIYEFPAHGMPVQMLSIFCAITGETFSAREW